MKSRTTTPDIEHQSAAALPDLFFVGSDKGGVGKSFTTALLADLLEIRGIAARLVQIDEQDRLPGLYLDRVTTVPAASLDDLRRDPSAIVGAFDPLYGAIERTIADRVPTIVDIGGPQQQTLESYCALVDLDADLVEAGLSAAWLVPATAEPEAMRGAVRTVRVIGRVLPSVARTIVLNGRDGAFRFYPGSPADKIWREDLEPNCRTFGAVSLPAIAPGSWQPIEAAGQRFVDAVAAEVVDIQRWTGRSRPAAKVVRGDIAAFLACADAALAKVLGASKEVGNGD